MNAEFYELAACRDIQEPIFISSNYEDIELAKEICATCPVEPQCLVHYYDSAGVIAGTSEYDRLVVRWKRIENVRDSNWRPTDYILERFIEAE